MTYINDIPEALANSAFAGTSFTPEKRGASYRADYAATLERDYAAMQAEAEKGGTLAGFDAEFARYREGYAKRYRAWLASHGRCISSMITGPARFPTARAEKRSRVADARMNECIEYRERALSAMRRNLRPDLRPIMSGDADAVERLAAEITKAESVQAHMKSANAAIRKYAKAGHAAQAAALVDLGFSPKLAEEALKPDFCGRLGFAGFDLSNNSANIRRMRDRLEQIKAAHATAPTEKQGDGVRLEDCPADNRVRLFFDGKPDADIRGRLKSCGFRWAPSVGAWQAYRNTRSLAVAGEFVA